MPDNDKSSLYKSVAFAVIFISFGLFMPLMPDMMDTASASGRNSVIKQLMVLIWGIPGGVLFLAIGGFSIYRAIQVGKAN